MPPCDCDHATTFRLSIVDFEAKTVERGLKRMKHSESEWTPVDRGFEKVEVAENIVAIEVWPTTPRPLRLSADMLRSSWTCHSSQHMETCARESLRAGSVVKEDVWPLELVGSANSAGFVARELHYRLIADRVAAPSMWTSYLLLSS